MADSDDGFSLATQDDLTAFTQPDNTPVPQDTSTPVDKVVAQLNDQANARIRAGEPEDKVESDLIQKVQSVQNNAFGKASTPIKKSDDDGFQLATSDDVQSFLKPKAAPAPATPAPTAPSSSLGDLMAEGAQGETEAARGVTSSAGADALKAAAMNYTPLGLVPQIAGGLAGLGKMAADASGVSDIASQLSSQAGQAGIGAAAGVSNAAKTTPVEAIENTEDALTPQPKTELGQQAADAIGTPWRLLGDGAKAAGEKAADITGSPLVGTAVETGLQLSPALLGEGARGIRALHETPETRAARIKDLSDQVIKDHPNADQTSPDQGSVPGAGADEASSGNASDAASQPEPAAEAPTAKESVNDQDTGSRAPDSARPAKAESEQPAEQGAKDLPVSADENPVTARFQEKLKNHDQAVSDYSSLPDSKGGTVLNTDLARELSDDYKNDRTLSADVHEPASAFVKKLYAEKLAEPTPEGKENTVLFTAGGTGAGKSSGLDMVNVGNPEITYDTNMNKLSSASAKVEQALDAGRNVHIIYTYRDPVEAFRNGALKRANRMETTDGSGRTVPIDEHVNTHVGASSVMRTLAEHYKDDPRVQITAIDNSRGKGQQAIVPLESLPRVEENGLKPALHQQLEEAHANNEISTPVYRGFQGSGEKTSGGIRAAGEREAAAADSAGRRDSSSVATNADRSEELVYDRSQAEAPLNDTLYHRAYHGSPHDFDQFSLDKIGTGEGAQAYGHGLYFAGNKEVADHYKQVLAKERPLIDGGPLDEKNPTHVAAAFVHEYGGDRTLATDALKNEMGYTFRTKAERDMYAQAIREIDSGKKMPSVTSGKGHGYVVELAPKEHEYLDWDKPLSEQPHALEKLRNSEYIKPLEKAIKDQWTTAKNVESLTGADVEGILRTYVKNVPSAGAWADIGHRGNAPLAAARLHEAGIPGIRYLNGSSRGKGDGAHNYVLFNDKDISVVNKYRRGQAEADTIKSPDEARKTATSAFGEIGKSKLERSGLNYVSRSEIDHLTPELTPLQRDGVKGLTANGKPYVVYDNVSHDELPNTVVHEVWHANADRVLPPDKQTQLANAIRQRAKSSPEVQAALDRIPKKTKLDPGTPKHNLDKEVIAQTLGDLHNQPLGKKVLDTIKLGLNRLGVPLGWLNAHDAALREIGIQNLKHFADSPHSFQADNGERHTAATYKPRIKVPVENVPVNRVEDHVPEEPKRVTSIKNAQVNKEREERGAEILHSVKGATDKEAMSAAGERLAKDPDLGRRLTAELLKEPRPLNKTEVAVMLHDRVRIHNDLQDAYDAAEKNPNDAGNVARIKDLELQRDANDQADRLAGTENSLGLSARRMMADEDYSLVNMVKRLQVASGKKDLAPAVMKHVREIDRQLKALTPKRQDNSKKAITDEFASLKNELAAISKKPSSKPTAVLYARAEPHIADVIRRMATNRQAAGIPEDVALRQIHEAVSPHADLSIADVKDAINEPKNARRQGFLDKKEGELGRKIAQKDFTKQQRYKPVYNEDTLAQEGKINALQRRFDNLKRLEEQKNQSAAMKVGATIHNTHLASILASVRVYPKLAAAVVARYISHGLEQATGALVQHIPGIGGIARMAESQRVSLGGEGQYLRGIGKSFKNAKDQLLRGYSDLDAKYGGKDTITDEYTDYAGSLFGGVGDAIAEGRKLDALRGLTSGVARFEGRTHGMIKEFASTPKFYESYFNIAQKLQNELRDSGMKEPEIQEFMSRRSTDMTIGSKAYLNALEDKLQGKNALADGINRMLVSWDNSGNAGLQGLSLAFQSVFPIRKIPMNIAKEVSSLAFGGVKALAAARKEITPERADYIMKNIKKQGAGAALFAIGYLAGPSVFGGVPQSGDAKKHLAVKPGEANIAGVDVSDSAFHSATGQLLQLGAGYRRAYESYYGASHNAITAGLEAFGDQFSSQMIRQIPYLDQPRRWMQTAEYAPRDKRTALGEIAGNQLRSMVVPGVVQQAARAQDPYQGYRKPKNILDDVKLGIPGLREEVPQR